MPKKIYIPEDATSSAITVTWTKSAQRIRFGGWYSGYTDLKGGSMSLRGFFDKLGITEADCAKAFERPMRFKEVE